MGKARDVSRWKNLLRSLKTIQIRSEAGDFTGPQLMELFNMQLRLKRKVEKH